jgi:2-polyprenyl-6-methoxyphenol hydroxylase-like FAD-dependent oxidoreductase
VRTLVIGGSVGGLMAGCLFRQAGCDVTVYERAIGDLAGRGAGLGVSRELLEVMRCAGARFEASAGVAQSTHVWMETNGKIAFEHRRNLMASAWARVYQPLRAALPAASYRQAMTLARIEEGAAIFADGTRESADLIVAADGVYSTVRKQFLPEVQPRFANYVAWRGLVPEHELPAATLKAVNGRIVFCFPQREMLLSMRVPGAVYFIWYRGLEGRALAELFTDAGGKDHGMSIPPPLIRPELVHELKAHAREVLPVPIAEVVQCTAQPLLQAISDMESPRMTFGHVALVGDAAFVVRPHVAGGASKAALDAAALVEATAHGDIAAGLARFEASQLDFGSRLVQHSRYLGADLEGRPTERDPARIIRDYGAPHLLHDVD